MLDAKKASYEVTSQALTIVTTTAAALGPAGVPLVIFAGSLNALLAICSVDYEPPVYVTTEDLQLVTDLIINNINKESLKQDARNAAADIATTYDWYAKYNQQYSGSKSLYEENIKTIKQQVDDALGPNSVLSKGLNLLKQRDVGKYGVRHYALGAGLHMKLLFLDVVLRAYRGEPIDRWSYIEGLATQHADKLGELIGAADMEIGINLEQWKKSHPNGTKEDWFKERDRNVYVLYGGASSLEDLNQAKIEFYKIAREASNRSQGQADTTALRYGEFYKYHIQNQYQQGKGGYLDTNGRSGEYLNVTTNKTPDRQPGTSTWAILPLPESEKKEGDVVKNNDVVLLKNLWSEKGGGYLDTNGSGGDHLNVCTSQAPNRKDNSGLWRIITESWMPEVQEHETVHLLNGWADWQGGFLDTNGGASGDGAFLNVTTARSWNRAKDSDSTHWKFILKKDG